jgi:dienelactone hydrolase
MKTRLFLCVSCLCVLCDSVVRSTAADPLPGTKPLTEPGDLARQMVDGIHKYLDRELAAAPKERDALWEVDASTVALAKLLPAKRERLRKILGVVDERVKPNLEYVSGPGKPSLVAEIDACKIHAVRWAVLPGVDAEGLLIEPQGAPKAHVVAIPHAGEGPEVAAGLTRANRPAARRDIEDNFATQITWLHKNDDFALRLARHGCRVLVPTLIDRNDGLSGNPKLNRQTNIPHREFVYRMAYEMGRTLTGYEVQKVLAAVDWFTQTDQKLKVGVIGYGDGGMIALYAGALDERIAAVQVSGYFDHRERLYQEPIDRNVCGLLREFGDAELGAMIHPRKFVADVKSHAPTWAGPAPSKPGRGGAAPGRLSSDLWGSDFEEHRYRAFLDPKLKEQNITMENASRSPSVNLRGILGGLGITTQISDQVDYPVVDVSAREARHRRQFDQLVAYTQKLWRDSEAVRKEFWKKADAKSPEAWEKSCDWYRDYFHREVIGKLPDPTMPLNPRTRVVYDEPNWTGYEVVLDVYPDVIASGILLLPKDLKPGERRPVVVCQHGLEGRPQDVCNPKEKTRAYNSFGARLADRGYIVYAPQNPYIFEDHFRQLRRKADPLKLSLFSFIIAQHKRTLDWLETLPNVDPKKIGFYGLSYGGKTAMRVPAVEKRYCLSICSGDFNEWIGKCVSVGLDRSYMWTREYDMYEFDLGNTFNYAEMAYLIAPRPFMVERGHDDGVGTDEMVAYEYAKVRYLYANKLKIPDRTAIEFSPGGHEVFLKGTLAFLEKHLGKP